MTALAMVTVKKGKLHYACKIVDYGKAKCGVCNWGVISPYSGNDCRVCGATVGYILWKQAGSPMYFTFVSF